MVIVTLYAFVKTTIINENESDYIKILIHLWKFFLINLDLEKKEQQNVALLPLRLELHS